jgi:hypothetical protein
MVLLQKSSTQEICTFLNSNLRPRIHKNEYIRDICRLSLSIDQKKQQEFLDESRKANAKFLKKIINQN